MKRKLAIAAIALWLACPAADAAMPVIDIAAVRSLITQVNAWKQQLRAMQLQLTQLQQTRDALTGRRGMERLLPLTLAARNYLPSDWSALANAAHGIAGNYARLAADVHAQLESNALLTAAELSRLPANMTAQLEEERRAVALGQTLARAAYARSSDRFSELSQLIANIAGATDAKAIADLQGRIGAEQAMLGNEGIKLEALARVSDAERSARDLQRREAVASNHGSFPTRFQPNFPVP